MFVRDFDCTVVMDSVRYRVNVVFQRMSIRTRETHSVFVSMVYSVSIIKNESVRQLRQYGPMLKYREVVNLSASILLFVWHPTLSLNGNVSVISRTMTAMDGSPVLGKLKSETQLNAQKRDAALDQNE